MMSVVFDVNGLQESFQNLTCLDSHPTAGGDSPTPAQASEKKPLEKPPNQPYHSFLCIDFESSCINADDPTLDNPTQLTKSQLTWLYPNEIIEWPVILLQWRTNQDGNSELYEAGRYRRFVRPVWRPILSQFCMDLTGISQNEVDRAMTLDQVLRDFDQSFVKPHKLFTPGNQTVWVTDGPWDFRDHFVKSTFLAKIDINCLPRYLRSPIALIDLRYLLKAYIPNICSFPPPDSLSLFNAMAAFGLDFEGQQHSGIDDAHNVARLLAEMVRFSIPDGSQTPQWIFRLNRRLYMEPRRFFWMSKKFKCTWTLP
ncbi:hypothetical protein PtA15_16A59 [Puccinia triticina]|uniref:Exonuclease domain-containing protein n=1 Tax=Puccinia triticina TaxID=208348 RepID=A0ABY7D3G0_9BASI|nr:uncharacterized protein PtA15_16A59 [Puccinia triticina]WAQ92153.1 hypothetical protein PtA15_16A59 [Puccinia triticina]WAR63894.1 hypothetical protein PtB15_16B53 [Puccinia triticina]